MAATSQQQSITLENEAKRDESSPVSPTPASVSDQEDRIVGRIFSGVPGEPPPDGTARFLQSSTLSHPANAGMRVLALKRAQQTHGNRFAQRVVLGIQRKATPRIVQRECTCGGTCEKCQAAATTVVSSTSFALPPFAQLIQAQAADSSGAPQSETPEFKMPDGEGEPLDEKARVVMESRFGSSFSDVRVHNSSEADATANALNADAFTIGSDIYFAGGQYAPETSGGQRLLAHELTHTIQQSSGLSAAAGSSRPACYTISQPDDPLELEAATVASQVMSDGPGARVGILSSPTTIARQEPDSPPALQTTTPTSGMPSRAGISVSMAGMMFLPTAGATFNAGSKARQGLAIALYRLLGDQFRASYVDTLFGRLTAAGWGGIGTLSGDAAGGEPITEFGIPLMESLTIIGWIHAQRLENRLGQSERDLLRFGMFASRAWNDINRTYASELSDTTLPRWFTEDLFRQELASRIELLRRYIDAYVANQTEPSADSRGEIVNVLQEILTAVDFNVAMLEAIRGDGALIGHSVYQLLWPPPRPAGLAPGTEPPPAMAGANRAPAPFFASSFMAFMNTQPSLVTQAWTHTDARRELMDRFERYSSRTLLGGSAGDQQVTETPATANASALPSQIGVSPPLSGPPGGAHFEGSSAANYRFVMSIQFPDVFTAFTNYYFEWNYVRVPDDMIGRSVKFDDLDPQSPDYGAVAARSFSHARQYAVEDVETVFRELGPAGVGAINLVSANAILRFLGTGIRLFFGYLTRPASETDVAFPGVGVYMVRAKAIPYQGENPEMVRPPSVGFQPVIIRDPTDLVEDRVRQDVAISQRDDARMKELIGILSEPASHVDEEDMRHELDILERSLSSVGGSLEVQHEQIVSYRDSQREGSRERADAERQLERLDQIIAVRTKRAESHNLAGAEPLLASFVSDDGQNIRLAMEAVREPSGEGSSTYWVSDLTTPNSSQNIGTGEDRPTAIMNAVENILRGQGGYGRGYVSAHIDGRSYTRRITASMGSLLMEAIENVATALSLAVVVAAPFTGGATLVLLLPIGAIGAIPSAYRLINRDIDGTLRFDLETVMDIVNIVGGVVGLAHAATPLRMVNAGRVLYIMGLGTDALGVLMIPAGVMMQIDQLGDLPPGERAARIMEILGQAMLNVGIMVGGSLGQRARQHQMENHATPPSEEHGLTPDGRRLTTPDAPENRALNTEPSAEHTTTDPNARTRTGNPDAPSLVEGLARDGMSRVRVTAEGRLVVCHSPCTFLEEMFPRELSTNQELRSEFDRILRLTERQMRREPQNREPSQLQALDDRAIRLWERLEAAKLEFNRTVNYSRAEFPGHGTTLDNIQIALSHIDAGVPELAHSRAHLAEVINDVTRLQSQQHRIEGLEDWMRSVGPEAEVVATAGTRDQNNPDELRRTRAAASGVARKVAELYEARRLTQQYAGNPDIVIRIGQDGTVRDPVTGEQRPSFDISVERTLPSGERSVIRRIEVMRVMGDILSHIDLRDGIVHGADKIYQELVEPMRRGDQPLPPEAMESTVQINWPPPVPADADARHYRPDGTYAANPRDPGSMGSLQQDLLYSPTQGLAASRGPYTEIQNRHVHLLSAITIIDQNGAVLWRFTNQAPGRVGRWVLD